MMSLQASPFRRHERAFVVVLDARAFLAVRGGWARSTRSTFDTPEKLDAFHQNIVPTRQTLGEA